MAKTNNMVASLKNLVPALLIVLALITLILMYAYPNLSFLLNPIALSSVLTHEAGHALSALAFGIDSAEIEILGINNHTLDFDQQITEVKYFIFLLSGFLFSSSFCFFLLFLSSANIKNTRLPVVFLAGLMFFVSIFSGDDIVVDILIAAIIFFMLIFFLVNPILYYLVHFFSFVILVETVLTEFHYLHLGLKTSCTYKASIILGIPHFVLVAGLMMLILIGVLIIFRIWFKTGLFSSDNVNYHY